ncbi:UNVERIFIED_CONTAM: hypothetical protein GTU68_067255 [Idotea baltica]|nr:hypothetical protein [Idotea baltica]
MKKGITEILYDQVKVETITEKGKNPIVKIDSTDKQLIGQVAAKIRAFRKPEPYKGKGIRFKGEQIRTKAGKTAGHTVAAASSVENGISKEGDRIVQAKKVGELIANKAKGLNISDVIFDRGGYLYHGRIKSLADGAREGGLKF